MRRGFALRWALAVALVVEVATAQEVRWDRTSLPDRASPPSIADLTHRGVWLGVEETVASVKPKTEEGAVVRRSVATMTRLEAEAELSAQRWFVGAAGAVAYGKDAESGSSAMLLGYPELWGRGVWADPVGLTYGGGVTLTIPAFTRGKDSQSARVADNVRVVRPWDFPTFADNTFTATPYLDARVVDGRVTIQLRQGIAFGGLVAEARVPKASLVSRTTLFTSYQPIEALSLGLEVWEVYFLSADLPDYQRGVFAVSPSVRLMTRVFQPTLSVILPYDRPLFDRADSFWAVRLSFGAILDRR